MRRITWLLVFGWAFMAANAVAVQPGEIVEVRAYGNWGTVGKVLRTDSEGVLVLYRDANGGYDPRNGFTRVFNPNDVRPLAASAERGRVAAASAGAGRSEPPSAATGAYAVGDRVEGWNLGWYAGTVVRVGDGSYAGYYLIHHDDYGQDAYYAEANVRRLEGAPARGTPGRAATPTTAGTGPKAGTYGCGVFLSGRYTPTQTLTLADGRYTTTHGNGGGYTYDGGTRQFTFNGGSLADQVGQFEPENAEIIRLTRRADLAESRSTQQWRSQVCSPR